jgi:hypothetical protein
MFRNLKALLLAAVALTAFGAVGAASALAAEFHCATDHCRLTLKPDGAGATAHQTFIFRKGGESFALTCETISGESTPPIKTTSELTFSVEYKNCNSLGATEVKMNGCQYLFTAKGELSIQCPEGKKIELKMPSWGECVMTIESQGPLFGFKYHNIEAKAEITIESTVKGIKSTIDKSAICGIPSGEWVGESTTGNAIITGETDDAEAKMVNVWWE